MPARVRGHAAATYESDCFQSALEMLNEALDACEVQSPSLYALKDIAGIRAMLDVASPNGFSVRSPRSPDYGRGSISRLTRVTEEYSAREVHTAVARTAVKTTSRWSADHANAQVLTDFRARIIRVASGSRDTRAVIAEVRRLATATGPVTLPPTIYMSAVIHPDSEIFRLVDHDDIKGVQHLLRTHKASIRDCDVFGHSVLHRAAWNCSADLWAMLLAEGADVDGISSLATPPLMLCSGVDYHRKLQLALEAGADPSLMPGGQFYMATMDATAVRSILRISGPLIDMRLRNASGRTLLLVLAAATANRDQALILRLLLRAGASPHDSDPKGNTCLHYLVQAMRPNQPQCLEALVVLLEAGASPGLQNNEGLCALDLVNIASVELGSFRRDIFHQACLRTGYQVFDEALQSDPSFTAAYTPSHSAALHGSVEPSAVTRTRNYLLERLIETVDSSSVFARYQLHETAVDRVMALDATPTLAETDQLLIEALNYLRLMIKGKKQVVMMNKDRLPYQNWAPYSRGLGIHWLRLREEAELAALLEFDWFRPVDYEDLFLGFVDGLTQLLEDFKPKAASSTEIDRLIEVLEGALPSRQEMLQRHVAATTGKAIGLVSSVANKELPRLITHPAEKLPLVVEEDERCDSMSPDDRARHTSMLQTPAQFYSPEALEVRDAEERLHPVVEAALCLQAGDAAKKWRRGATAAL